MTLCCDNSVMKSVVDKFGIEISTNSVGKNMFRTKVKVCTGPTFYLWVFGASGKISIERPAAVRKAYKEMLQNALDNL